MRGWKTTMLGALVVVLVLALPLFSGCNQEIAADRVPDLLREKVANLKSYQLTLSIAQAGGLTHDLQQWYTAPGSLRTDVLRAGQPLYRFLLKDGILSCKSFADGLDSELPATTGNALFLEPVLISLWREVLAASFEHNGQNSTFSTELQWQGLDKRVHAGRLVLDATSLSPVALHLFAGEQQLQLTIQFSDVVLNPKLSEKLFTP